jgi:hypothetical protein
VRLTGDLGQQIQMSPGLVQQAFARLQSDKSDRGMGGVVGRDGGRI